MTSLGQVTQVRGRPEQIEHWKQNPLETSMFDGQNHGFLVDFQLKPIFSIKNG